MARRRSVPVFEPVYYHGNTKTCQNGHKGRIGRVTKLCAGCLQAHLEGGGYKWVSDD